MKLLVIGDSHGNIANIKHVMGFAKKINAGAVIHTGDWDNVETIKTVLEYKIPLFSVLGNADIDPNFKFKEFLEINLDKNKIYIIHKLLKSDKRYLSKDIVFTGHYHSQKVWYTNGVKVIRPGALENNVNFAIFDTKTKMVEFIHE